MKISLTRLYTPKEVTFDNVKEFSIVILRRSSRSTDLITDVGVEIESAEHFGCERITIEEEQ